MFGASLTGARRARSSTRSRRIERLELFSLELFSKHSRVLTVCLAWLTRTHSVYAFLFSFCNASGGQPGLGLPFDCVLKSNPSLQWSVVDRRPNLKQQNSLESNDWMSNKNQKWNPMKDSSLFSAIVDLSDQQRTKPLIKSNPFCLEDASHSDLCSKKLVLRSTSKGMFTKGIWGEIKK